LEKGENEKGIYKKGELKGDLEGRGGFFLRGFASFPKMGPGGINGEVEIIEIL